MKKSIVKVLVLAAFLAFGAMSMSSCNKGYGCPSDFSLGAITPVQLVIQ